MDYYASWPRWTVPKWVGVALGGIFTLIIVVCAGMIVHLLRPPARAARPVVAAAAQPKLAPALPTAIAPAPAIAAAAVAHAAPVAAPAPAATTAAAASPAPAVAHAAKKHAAHAHKRAILAKHDGKSSRSSKDPIDRLLGL